MPRVPRSTDDARCQERHAIDRLQDAGGWSSFPSTALTPMGRPVDAVATAVLSVLGVLAGAVVYTILTRLLDTARANRWFLIIAIVVLVLMAPSPFGIPAVPASQIVIMEIMHLVAGTSAIYFLSPLEAVANKRDPVSSRGRVSPCVCPGPPAAGAGARLRQCLQQGSLSTPSAPVCR